MKTSTYIRAAAIAASEAADMFDGTSIWGGPIRKAARRLKQSTTFTDKAINQADKLEAERDDAHALAADYSERMGELCDYAWSAVYPGKTDWEYPAQAIRHLVTYVGELKAKIKTQENSNG